MVDSVCRLLRDGVVEGEYAPALLVQDSLSTTGGPAVFRHFVRSIAANISSGRAQAKGLVMVTTDRHPECYRVFLENEKSQIKGRCQVIDCFSDPLGWDRAIEFKQCQLADENSKQSQTAGVNRIVYREIRDMTSLMSAILESAQLLVGRDNNVRFSVIIDSVSTLLRHNLIHSIASLLNALRSHSQLSSLLCMLHADLHATKIVHALEYLSSIVTFVEPCPQSRSIHSFQDENQGRGIIRVRQKRWNGRVREQIDQFEIQGSEIKCSPIHEKTSVVMGKNVISQETVKAQSYMMAEKISDLLMTVLACHKICLAWLRLVISLN
eukprot:c20069_g1_i3 orf=89-1060(+)